MLDAPRTAAPSGVHGSAGTSAPWANGSPEGEEACQQFTGSGDFAYRCDRCHARVWRSGRQLFVFCSEPCRRAYRAGRKRLIRNFRGVHTYRGDELWNLGAPDVESTTGRGPSLDGFSARDSLAQHDDADDA